ncbi:MULTISPECIES: hypothetical protein [unclassified Cellulomonas]|uniref:hypothetical protein n=1 Tax=unclassified Cellulomonas TaxID=2620175 RepID=UPI001C300267|nr:MULTISPECIES: hypothetical protein [unclassified Cellulomonas]MBW0253908.1 hypothetical protein [Cellulomonas sp. PS-H5]
MGTSEKFQYGDGRWGGDLAATPSLAIEVQDSDIAVIDYRPAPEGLGRFYLGFQPRDLYDDPAESEPVDIEAEAEAFATWAESVGALDVQPNEVRRLMAIEGEEPEDTFVEETVVRLLRLLGLSVPKGLAG